MKLHIAVNSDGSEIISKQPLKRFIDYEHNKGDVICFNDITLPPHWILDYDGIYVPKTGVSPIDVYLTLPTGSIKRMFGFDITWEDECKTIDLDMKREIEKAAEENTSNQLKFKVGDQVHCGDEKQIITITGLRDDAYLTDSAYGVILFSEQENWELVD